MDTDNIDYCHKCGVIYNREIVCNKLSPHDTGYHTHIYIGNCPACKVEVQDER